MERMTFLSTIHHFIAIKSLIVSNQCHIYLGPKHGQIIQQSFNMPVKTFTLRELQTGRLGYLHNGESQEERDLLLLQVTDGYYILNYMISINIRQKVGSIFYFFPGLLFNFFI